MRFFGSATTTTTIKKKNDSNNIQAIVETILTKQYQQQHNRNINNTNNHINHNHNKNNSNHNHNQNNNKNFYGLWYIWTQSSLSLERENKNDIVDFSCGADLPHST